MPTDLHPATRGRLTALTSAVAGVFLGLVAVTLLPSAAVASDAKAPAPQLSIAIDNGRSSAAAGDTLRYTVRVENLGATRVTGLRVSQTTPAGLRVRAADAKGITDKAGVLWHVSLAPAGHRTMHTTMTVSRTPGELLRLASVACAAVSEKQAPIVCATHSDQLPAGAAARAAAAGTSVGGSSSSRTAWLGGTAGVVLLGLGIGAVVLVRRRRDEAS